MIDTAPSSWKHAGGRPRLAWSQVIECDSQPLNVSVHTAWQRERELYLPLK